MWSYLRVLLVARLAIRVMRGGGVSMGGWPLSIGWLHVGVTIVSIGRSLVGHLIRRWHGI